MSHKCSNQKPDVLCVCAAVKQLDAAVWGQSLSNGPRQNLDLSMNVCLVSTVLLISEVTLLEDSEKGKKINLCTKVPPIKPTRVSSVDIQSVSRCVTAFKAVEE